MKKFVSLVLACAMSLSLVACGSSSAPAASNAPAASSSASQSTPAASKSWPRMTIGGADSTGTMYAAAAAIATTLTNTVDGMTVDASTSSGSNENALLVHQGEIELGMCTGDAALNAYNGKGKFAEQVQLRE